MSLAPLDRILYVEDEPDIRTIAQLALESVGGFILEVCCDGFEAVEKAQAFAPDLIVLDVMMPGMDGPGTMQALRALPGLAGTPVIFMTAKVQPNEMAKYKSMGAAGVIAKPFDPMTLSDQIREIWSRKSSQSNT